MPPPKLSIHPPLLNSASPWATTKDQLLSLLRHPSTGAVTTRTALLPRGFAHDDAVHRYAFFDPAAGALASGFDDDAEKGKLASVNCLGYSPLPLAEYLDIIRELAAVQGVPAKTIIISVTGSPEEVAESYNRIAALAPSISLPLAMEINLSCPNIPNAPPPAYSPSHLSAYLSLLPSSPTLPVGIKTPPYTYHTQFETLISALRPHGHRLSFVTATNTLGGCLLLPAEAGPGAAAAPVLPGGGLGGMAGAPLHPLALGNVATLRRMLDAAGELAHVSVVGVGGVRDGGGYVRMRQAGAYAVGLATALGREGEVVFENIERDVEGEW